MSGFRWLAGSLASFGLLTAAPMAATWGQEQASVARPSSVDMQTGGRWVDLTHPFDETTIYWPTEDGFQLSVENYGMTAKGYFYASNRFTSAEHGGTHLDAPIHFAKGGKTVDQLSLDRFIGKAAVIDVSKACEQDADYEVSIEDLRAWEVENRRQLVDVIVLLHTGFGSRWPDRKRYLGTDRLGPDAVAELHFPGLSPDAAKWLTEHRAIKAIGIDTASIDHGQSERFQSHVTLFANNVPAFENVANLHLLPSIGATVIALPMKITGGTGGPLRVVASIPATDEETE
jgi:kynurenine formamidase